VCTQAGGPHGGLRTAVDDPPGQTVRRAANGPDVWSGVWQEMVAHRLWLDRAVVPAFAGTTGLAVVGVTLLAEAASRGQRHAARPQPLGVVAQ
jgi:hypothetical protein